MDQLKRRIELSKQQQQLRRHNNNDKGREAEKKKNNKDKKALDVDMTKANCRQMLEAMMRLTVLKAKVLDDIMKGFEPLIIPPPTEEDHDYRPEEEIEAEGQLYFKADRFVHLNAAFVLVENMMTLGTGRKEIDIPTEILTVRVLRGNSIVYRTVRNHTVKLLRDESNQSLRYEVGEMLKLLGCVKVWVYEIFEQRMILEEEETPIPAFLCVALNSRNPELADKRNKWSLQRISSERARFAVKEIFSLMDELFSTDPLVVDVMFLFLSNVNASTEQLLTTYRRAERQDAAPKDECEWVGNGGRRGAKDGGGAAGGEEDSDDDDNRNNPCGCSDTTGSRESLEDLTEEDRVALPKMLQEFFKENEIQKSQSGPVNLRRFFDLLVDRPELATAYLEKEMPGKGKPMESSVEDDEDDDFSFGDITDPSCVEEALKFYKLIRSQNPHLGLPPLCAHQLTLDTRNSVRHIKKAIIFEKMLREGSRIYRQMQQKAMKEEEEKKNKAGNQKRKNKK